MALLSSVLFGKGPGNRQHSAMYRTAPGNQVPALLDLSEVSSTVLGNSRNIAELFHDN